MRKYDFLAGRFTSPDPLWEKYVSLTPYQYAGNNPVTLFDDNGREIINGKISKENIENFNCAKDFLRGLNSPTVNRILDLAEGKKSKVYLNSFDRPETGNTKSHVGSSYTLEESWEIAWSASGITKTTVKSGDMKADVIIDKQILENVSNDNDRQVSTRYAANVILDELNHAVSTIGSSNEKAGIDHQSLYENLKYEIDNGIIENTWENTQWVETFNPANKPKD